MGDGGSALRPQESEWPATELIREWINEALTPLPGDVVGMPFWPHADE